MSKEGDNSTAIVTFPQDMPALPDLKGKVGGATIKASEEESTIAEMEKKVSSFFIALAIGTIFRF